MRVAYSLVGLLMACSSSLALEAVDHSGVDTKLACELVKHQGALLLDVRTGWEYAWSRIPGAKNIWVGDLPMQLEEVERLLDGNRDSPVVVYCTKGVRAAEAKKILQKAGFTNVTNLGGISDWQKCE